MIRKPLIDEPEPEKKERVIHTRVPESLEAELRQKAQDLGISVSNLVRNVLGHAFGLVGDVVADSQAIARAARAVRAEGMNGHAGDASRASPDRAGGERAGGVHSAGKSGPRGEHSPPRAAEPAPDIDDVLGWQPMVLGKNAVCARCNDLLPRGSDAAIGIAESTGGRLVICLGCLEQLRVAAP
ncbi:MAG TPA: hypothetical protein VLM79_07995 [Kofleriaceae bacterium]|nr:hypothetical protein [Kofleriaceae bacterium]